MQVAIVVDVGNSRIKWGRCENQSVVDSRSLTPDAEKEWAGQLEAWKLGRGLQWAVCGVHPARRDRFIDWVRGRGDSVWLLEHAAQLPMAVVLEHPDRVGIDRLLDALAAKHRNPGTDSIVVDAGSAVTVDWVDHTGAFRGGTIAPGPRLMSESLHRYTALLPLIQVQSPTPSVPGVSTPLAMEAGILWTIAGGIQTIADRLERQTKTRPSRYLTGGDASLLTEALGDRFQWWPTMTLEGIRIAAEAQP
jgi:type III pantothenate kinase